MTYNLKNESYSIFVRSTTSIDTHFLLEYSDEEIWDDYEHSVFSDQNTLDRFVDEYKNSFLSLVQKKTRMLHIFLCYQKNTPNIIWSLIQNLIK